MSELTMSKSQPDVAQSEHEEQPMAHPASDEMPEKVQLSKAPPSRSPAHVRNSSTSDSLYSPTANKKISDGTLKNLTNWLLENQTGFSFNLIALLLLTHICIPKARQYTSKFFTLSHYNPRTGKYAAGFDDFYFMTFCIVLFTGLRAGFMDHVLAPLARKWGISTKKEVTRFSEQAWLVIYCGVIWPYGLYIYCNSPYYLNMDELWTNWPDRELDGLMKVYILAQWSFWIQQLLVINIEDRRKDHWQMLTHHFITITLISSAYAYHYIKAANLVLVMMDVVDLFLPLAKCLKYLGYTTICDVLFGLFMVSWFLARHVLYMMTCWSIYVDVPRLIPQACYSGSMDDLKGPFPVPNDWTHVFEPFRNPQGIVCLNDNIRYSFLFYLIVLQAITIVWFVFIVQVAIRVIKGGNAEDVRSDDEAEEEAEDELEYDEGQLLQEEVGVEDIDLKGWERRAAMKRAASSSGVVLPRQSDHKELLNRIGCKQQID